MVSNNLSVCVSVCLSVTNFNPIISGLVEQNGLKFTKIASHTCTIPKGGMKFATQFTSLKYEIVNVVGSVEKHI